MAVGYHPVVVGYYLEAVSSHFCSLSIILYLVAVGHHPITGGCPFEVIGCHLTSITGCLVNVVCNLAGCHLFLSSQQDN